MGRRDRTSPTWVPPMSCLPYSSSQLDAHSEENFHQTGLATGMKKWFRFRKSMRSFTLFLFSSSSSSSSTSSSRRKRIGGGDEVENHRSWLLADTHVEDGMELQSSPLRFSFESHSRPQMEADGEILGVKYNSESHSASVLVLSLEEKEEEEEEYVSMLSSSSSDETGGGGDSFLLRNFRRLNSSELSISPIVGSTQLIRFKYQDILIATQDFLEGRLLVRGPSSSVYKGQMQMGWKMMTRGGSRSRRRRRRCTVAIKKLHGTDKESFCKELLITGSLRNPNVVPILGFCIDSEGLFFVYNYISGRSLDLHLHPEEKDNNNNNNKKLSWNVRFKVALGTAGAMEYLHYGTDRCIVHGDINPSNILLSGKNTPKLCDFGLATWTEGPSLPFLCRNVRGTFGYMAPEYFQHGKLSDKADVYAFGVVLLELISGRNAIDTRRTHGDENLVLWAKRVLLPLLPLQQGEIGVKELYQLVDPRLRFGCCHHRDEMWRMVCAAVACLSNEESCRPRITQVINILCGK